MKNFGLSEKELKQIVDNIHPDGWTRKKIPGKKKEALEPSAEQLEAVRIHLESIYALDKRKAYLQQLVDRLRPEVEGRKMPAGSGRPA